MSVEPTSVADLRYECPVCMEPLFPPVFQCHNGHLMCEGCSARLENCGLCRAVLPEVNKVRSLEVERIIRMIKHSCPNQIDGCLAKVDFNKLEAHRLECDYRKFPICRDILGCNCEEMMICDYEAHLQRKHKTAFGVSRTYTLPVTEEFSTWPVNHRIPLKLPLSFKFIFEGKPILFVVMMEFDAATNLVTWKPYVLARAVGSQLNFKLSLLSGQRVKFMLESPVFNLETKPEELLACPGIPLNFFRTNFDPSRDSNEIGYHRFRIELSRKDETLPNEQVNSAMESS